MNQNLETRFAAARSAFISKQFRLNPMQLQACMATEGPLLLLAGAGSGKTTVLINRVANLLRYGCASDSAEVPVGISEGDMERLKAALRGEGSADEDIHRLCALRAVKPWQVLAITFTNKAAGELKERLAAKLGPEANDVWAMTFHATCARILRRDADRLGFGKSFTIYDSADSQSVMKRVLKELELDEKSFPPRQVLAACSRYKGALLTPDEFVAQEERSGDIRRKRTAMACAAYAKRLKDADAMDFDDLIYFAVILLRDCQEVREYYQQKFRYVLVDEYQDTSHLQYELCKLLSGGYRNLCVVGDDDQSIYKFRGATIENILSFQKEYPDARVIRLEQNYRSTGNILDAANAVIANNTARMGKNLWTQAGKGELLYEYVAMSEDDEADFVARTIQQSGRSPKDFAVLYRTNAQSRSIEQALKRRKINYRIFGGTRFFDRAEVKDILAYLCTVANPTDETRLLRILNNPPRGIGAAGVEKAQTLARREEKPLFDILRNATVFPELGRSAGRMQEFADMITGLQNDLAQGMPLDEFYDKLIEKSGYIRALEDKHSDEELARIENVHELKSSIVKSVEENQGGDLYAYLDEVALYSDIDNYDENAECTVLMTMHAAKGLEFPVVFIVGADDGLFPSALAIGDQSEMEEERRLCYVAITRAKERLYICEASQRMLYGRTNSYIRSRFIDEIPPELLESHDLRSRRQAESRCYEERDAYAPRPKQRTGGYASSTVRVTPPKSAAAKPKTVLSTPAVPDYKVGDLVEHSAFGVGTIAKLTPMGGDALVEISFEGVGTKKLMLRVAAQHMKKK